MKPRIKTGIHSENGAALMTVLIASLLLGTACVAMLVAVGASTQNNTDALSEAKAYWAAESGLQSTLNLLRNQGVSYGEANSDSDLSTWFGTDPVPVGSDASFTVQVGDPDGTSVGSTYSANGLFELSNGAYSFNRVFGTGADTVTVSYADVNTTNVTYPMVGGSSLGYFTVVSTGVGAPMTEDIRFKIELRISAPISVVKAIRGTIRASDRRIVFDEPTFQLLGSTVAICGNSSCDLNTLALPSPTTTPQNSATITVSMTAMDPSRLVVRATGYGPNGAKKVLEAIVQKNFFNSLSAEHPITMIGQGDCLVFQPGTSAQMDIDGGTSPSVGVPNTTGLDTVNSAHTNGTMEPPPAVTGDELPLWQRDVYAMDAMIRQLRQTAQNSGRYFTNYNGNQGWGNFVDGTGITFCEGSCTMGGNSEGGGILVVTGTFFTQGNPKFKGMIIAVGPYVDDQNPGGVVRGGGGQEVFLGTTIIAPYDPNNLAAGFQCPRYVQNGGPGDTINMSIDDTIEETNGVNNVMVGVVEK